MIVWTIIILHLDKVTAINEGSIPHLDGICLDGQFAIIQTVEGLGIEKKDTRCPIDGMWWFYMLYICFLILLLLSKWIADIHIDKS